MSDDLRQGLTPVAHRLLDIVEELGDDWHGRSHEACRNEAWELLKRARRTTCSGTAASLGLQAAAMLLLAAEFHEMYLGHMRPQPSPAGEGEGEGE